jgi:hypothetical protein
MGRTSLIKSMKVSFESILFNPEMLLFIGTDPNSRPSRRVSSSSRPSSHDPSASVNHHLPHPPPTPLPTALCQAPLHPPYFSFSASAGEPPHATFCFPLGPRNTIQMNHITTSPMTQHHHLSTSPAESTARNDKSGATTVANPLSW